MVHPAGTAGETVHSVVNIGNALVGLIEREYNKDASYRDPQDPAIHKVYFGEPAAPITPSIAVAFGEITYEDAPQDAGAEIIAKCRIICYGSARILEDQQKEAIRMAEAIRHILLDNPTIPNKEGVEQIFQIGYGEMNIVFDEFITPNFAENPIGVTVAILNMTAVWSELGY